MLFNFFWSSWKYLNSILSNLNNFHTLEAVDRVSETQLQVGENGPSYNVCCNIMYRFFNVRTSLLLSV